MSGEFATVRTIERANATPSDRKIARAARTHGGRDSLRDAIAFEREHHLRHLCCGFAGKRWRERNLPDGEPPQQFDDAVKMIEIGVREEQLVDPRMTAMPQERRDHATHRFGAAHRTGIVNEHAAIGGFEHGATAVADREKRDLQFVLHRGWHADEADQRPYQKRNRRPFRPL